MLDAIIEPIQNYYKELPDNTFTCVGRSALFSFVASVILSRGNIPRMFQSSLEDFRRPLFAATCAAVASLIHGLPTPLFNRLFGDDDQNMIHREFIKIVANVCLLKILLLAAAGNVEEMASRIIFLPANLFKSIFGTAAAVADYMAGANPAGRKILYDLGLISDPNVSSTYVTLAY